MSGFFRDELDEFHNVAGNKIFFKPGKFVVAAFLCSGEIFEETFCSKRQFKLRHFILRVYVYKFGSEDIYFLVA